VPRAAAEADNAGVKLVHDIAPNLAALRGDATRLRQVLLNLIVNAIKFTPRGGAILVRAQQDADGGLCLSVRDNGVGIDAADLPRVMQPFEQVGESYDTHTEASA